MGRVAVCGLGKLGAVMAALLADAGHSVVGVDPDVRVRAALDNRDAPVAEPGLDRLLAGIAPEALITTGDYAEAVDLTDAAMIVVPTPSIDDGSFYAGLVLDAVMSIGVELRHKPRTVPYLVVVCSTLSPGTMTGLVAPALEKASGRKIGDGMSAAYSPEFIALGTVIDDMRAPDMVLIGAQDRASIEATAALSTSFREPTPVRSMSFVEAEIAKLATNGYLSVKIGYANMIGAAVKRAGGDPHVVLDAIGADHRIGRAYLSKGGNPAGPCLPRDLVALEAAGRSLRTPMHLINAARDTAAQVVNEIMAEVPPGENARVALLGISYKPGSPITDDSLGRSVISKLCRLGVTVAVADPHAVVPPSDPLPSGVRWFVDVHEAIAEADTVIIGCPHPEFDDVDFGTRKVVNPWS